MQFESHRQKAARLEKEARDLLSQAAYYRTLQGWSSESDSLCNQASRLLRKADNLRKAENQPTI